APAAHRGPHPRALRAGGARRRHEALRGRGARAAAHPHRRLGEELGPGALHRRRDRPPGERAEDDRRPGDGAVPRVPGRAGGGVHRHPRPQPGAGALRRPPAAHRHLPPAEHEAHHRPRAPADAGGAARAPQPRLRPGAHRRGEAARLRARHQGGRAGVDPRGQPRHQPRPRGHGRRALQDAAHGAEGAMSAPRAVRLLLSDLSALFATEHAKPWFLVLAALVLQTAFWYLATPGPTLLRFATRDPLTAGAAVGWSLVFLLLLPALAYRLVVGRLDAAGLRWGDWRFGLSAVLGLAVVAVPLIALASGDAGLALTYPWAGAWP